MGIIQGMTGFGKARAAHNTNIFICEARSYNSRGKDVVIKGNILPTEWEMAIKDVFDGFSFYRGAFRIDLMVLSANLPYNIYINKAMLKGIESVLKKDGFDRGAIDVFNIPNALTYELKHPDRYIPVIKSVAKKAIEQVKRQRIKEGKAIKAFLKKLTKSIRAGLNKIKKRLKQNARQEVVETSAENQQKKDVFEEVMRFSMHLEMLDRLIALDDAQPKGKRMDFVCQELMREVNTFAAKVQNSSFAPDIVGIKTDVERIRELIANIE